MLYLKQKKNTYREHREIEVMFFIGSPEKGQMVIRRYNPSSISGPLEEPRTS